MTEAEWLACTDPQTMGEFLGSISDRKRWLFVSGQSSITSIKRRLQGKAMFADPLVASEGVDERVIRCNLLRDIFGNPFRPVAVSPAWLVRHDGIVARLAQAVYDNPVLPAGTLNPSRLAVLADALEEAGCTDPDILSHCRQPGEHVRGCWVVDLLLGKS